MTDCKADRQYPAVRIIPVREMADRQYLAVRMIFVTSDRTPRREEVRGTSPRTPVERSTAYEAANNKTFDAASRMPRDN